MTRTLSIEQLRVVGCAEQTCDELLALFGPGDIPVTRETCVRAAQLVNWSPYTCGAHIQLLGFSATKWDRYVILYTRARAVHRKRILAANATCRRGYLAEMSSVFTEYHVAYANELRINAERRKEKLFTQRDRARAELNEACAAAFFEAFTMQTPGDQA